MAISAACKSTPGEYRARRLASAHSRRRTPCSANPGEAARASRRRVAASSSALQKAVKRFRQECFGGQKNCKDHRRSPRDDRHASLRPLSDECRRPHHASTTSRVGRSWMIRARAARPRGATTSARNGARYASEAESTSRGGTPSPRLRRCNQGPRALSKNSPRRARSPVARLARHARPRHSRLRRRQDASYASYLIGVARVRGRGAEKTRPSLGVPRLRAEG
jgi:hypothetical protein